MDEQTQALAAMALERLLAVVAPGWEVAEIDMGRGHVAATIFRGSVNVSVEVDLSDLN